MGRTFGTHGREEKYAYKVLGGKPEEGCHVRN
jgi:hypothetical protein